MDQMDGWKKLASRFGLGWNGEKNILNFGDGVRFGLGYFLLCGSRAW